MANTMRKKFPISNFQLPISDSGFTLIEFMVAMGVFVIVLGIVVNIFIGALRSQRAAAALMAANDNASLALEQMMREIRVGSNFFIPGDNPPLPCISTVVPAIPSSGNELMFCNVDGRNVTYRLSDETIEREVDGRKGSITSRNVRVSRLQFQLGPSAWPPRITISLELGSQNPDLREILNNLQTTVSARNI